MDEKRKKLKCKLFPYNSSENPMFVVICSFYKGQMLLSKHKNRDTWETQGGHIEADEMPLDAAIRELYEESGVKDAVITPVCDYLGYDDEGSAYGVVYRADIQSLGILPESEMEKVSLFSELPEKLTYPNVTPVLFSEACKIKKMP